MNKTRHTTMVFAGPHRALVTAWAAPCVVFTAGQAVEITEAHWDTYIPAPLPDPDETVLTSADFDRLLAVLDEEQPNAALLRALARRNST